MKYFIKKITPSKVTKLYVDTINHISTKKFIFFAKEGNQNKSKKDLKDFIKNLDNKKNIVFVTHYVVISEALNETVSSGAIIVADKNFKVIGIVKIN